MARVARIVKLWPAKTGPDSTTEICARKILEDRDPNIFGFSQKVGVYCGKSPTSAALERIVEEIIATDDKINDVYNRVTALLEMADQRDSSTTARVMSISSRWAKSKQALNERNRVFAEDMDELLKMID